MTKIHQVGYRVYYEDTDAGGIMYHGNFINFCERARSELLREFGLPASKIVEELKTGFVVRHLDADYLAMARLDDLLTVNSHVIRLKNSSFLMCQEITLSKNNQNIAVFKMDVTLVCIDMKGKPTRIPELLREKFKDYLLDKES